MAVRVPAEAFPPGEWIKEGLEDRGWTQTDLAEILGRPVQLINELIGGKKSITPETAKGLAQAFGTSPQFWLNLDATYQLYTARDIDPSVELRARMYSVAPIREMIRRHWIESSSNPIVLEQSVKEFYGVDSLDDIQKTFPVAARMSAPYLLNASQCAWLRRAQQLGGIVSVSRKFVPSEVVAPLIERLRNLMKSPEELRHVPRIFADAGIRFVVLEHLTKTKIDGACLWLDKKSPVIAVSLRYDRIDYFWFTVLHELKHALSGDGLKCGIAIDNDLLIESGHADDERSSIEKEANEFARNVLIQQDVLEDFIIRKRPLFSETSIRGFANLHRVHPGIVVGQLQYRGEISYSKFRNLLVGVRSNVVQSALTDGWGHTVPPIIKPKSEDSHV